MRLFKLLGITLLTSTLFFSCMENKKDENESTSEEVMEAETTIEEETREDEAQNIIQTAVANENLSTLVTAIEKAELVETLSGEGPFTVFAPTNAAFAALPEGTVDTLLKDENKSKLSGILTYHVVSGKFDAATVVNAIKENDGTYTVTTVQGEKIDLSIAEDGGVALKDAKGNMSKVVMADIETSNGIVHAIDVVLMPK